MELSIVLAILVVLVAGTVSGLAAFGFALVAVPPLLLIFDPPSVTAIVFLLAMVTRWVVFKHSWRAIDWPIVLSMMPFALAGSIGGILAVKHLEAAYIELIASLVVIVSTLILLRGWTFPGAESAVAPAVSGLLAGSLGTATGMAGPPMAILFVSRGFTPQAFRGTMSAMFYFLGGVTLSLLASQELIHRSDLVAALILLPASVVGTVVGQRALQRFSALQFQRIVLTLLLITGIVGTLAALRHIVL